MMAPIIASLLGTLAQNGLGLLSSAIQAKGKEVVEEAIGFKIEVADRDSARTRDVEFIKRGMTNNRANLMFFLAVVMVGSMVWIVWKDQSINEYVKGIFTLVLGRFLGYLDNIYSFEFGTTRGSKDKDETIKQLTEGKQ